MFKLFSRKRDKSKEELIESNSSLNNRLTAIAEVNKVLVGVIDEQKVFDLITKKLAGTVKMNFPSIWIYNEELATISLASHSIPATIKGIAEKAIGARIEELTFSKSNPEEGRSTYFRVIETGKPIYSNDLYEHTRPFLNQRVAKLLERVSGMQLAVSVPIMVGGKPIGVLSAIWKERELSKEDDLTLFTFANQISTAIYNSQQYEERQSQIQKLESRNADLQALTSLVATVSKSLDPKEVAQSAVNLLNLQPFIVGAGITEHDPKRNVLISTAVTENQLTKKAREIFAFDELTTDVDDPTNQNSYTIRVFKTGKPVHTTDLVGYMVPIIPKRFVGPLTRLMGIKSVSIYPLAIHGKTVGTLAYYIKDKTYEELEPNRQQLLDTYSLQIGIALENASLYAESRTNQLNLQKANTDLEEAVNELREARRRERDMLDVMGHELRTPISIVRNALLMLDREHKKHDLQDEEIIKYLGMAIESTRREIFLIETLLSATKVDGSRIQLYLEKVGINDVIVDAIEAQGSTIETKGIQLVHTPAPDDLYLYSDRTRIQEIMDNLLSNAIKYTPKGKVEIKIWHDDQYAWVSVTDSGMGIAPTDMQQLGRKFFRAKQYVPRPEKGKNDLPVVRPGGTGLGLYVTFELIAAMDGLLYINSEIGKGSTFTFGLPLFKDQKPKQIDQTFDPLVQKARPHVFLNETPPLADSRQK